MNPTESQTGIEALHDLGAQFSRLEAAGDRPRVNRWQSAPKLAFVVGIAAVLGAFLTLTPPGRSVASAVGDFVGIGDEAPAPDGERAVYIDAGKGANDQRYEVTATTNRSETCFFVEFPDDPRGISSGNCLTGEGSRADLEEKSVVPAAEAAPASFGPESGIALRGLLAPRVGSVDVTYLVPGGKPKEAEVYFSKLDETLSDQIRSQDEAGFFLAFLSLGILTGTADDPKLLTEKCVAESLRRVSIQTVDRDGGTIATVNLGDVADRADNITAIPPPGFDSNAKVPLPGEKSSVDIEEETPVPYDPNAGGACAAA